MLNRFSLLIIAALLLVTFQNCAPVGFNTKTGNVVGKLGDDTTPIDMIDIPNDLPANPPIASEPPKENPPKTPPKSPEEPCDKDDEVKNPPVVKQPIAPSTSLVCSQAIEMFRNTTPSTLNSAVITGSGSRMIYAKSIASLDHRGSGKLVIVGSPDNLGIKNFLVRGSGDVVVCGMDIENFNMNGKSGTVDLYGGNILSDYSVQHSSGQVRIFSSGGTLLTAN
ncbi:MAG: hypothetical protein V4692_10215 [Bdellovibrionota bacterium]